MNSFTELKENSYAQVGSKAIRMLSRNILDLISKQNQGRKSHLSSPFLTDGSLKHTPEMLAHRIFISESLAHLIPFFPNLTGKGSITCLPWIHKDFTDEGSLKKWLQFSAMSDMTQFRVSEKSYSETF